MRKLSEIPQNEFTPKAQDIIIPMSSFVEMTECAFSTQVSVEPQKEHNIHKIFKNLNKSN